MWPNDGILSFILWFRDDWIYWHILHYRVDVQFNPLRFSLLLCFPSLSFSLCIFLRLHSALLILCLTLLINRTSEPPLSPCRSWSCERWPTRSAASSSSPPAPQTQRWWRFTPVPERSATPGCSSFRTPCTQCEYQMFTSLPLHRGHSLQMIEEIAKAENKILEKQNCMR